MALLPSRQPQAQSRDVNGPKRNYTYAPTSQTTATSINPGMVDTDFLKVYATASKMPKLNTEDVAQALYYTLETPPHVQVEDVTLQSVPIHGE
uniref:Uncharacterized protein n=1 Tax=Glossina palpalis gambiensis TaxID=67801 RepID=A0A1B0AV84_9MUSC